MKSQILFETLGCRLNQIESESAARFFADAGFSVTMNVPNASDPADSGILLCIVNTCTVTQKAEQKARREIRLLLEKCPLAAVIVTGCYAQLAQKEIAEISPRIAVLPGQCKDRLADVPGILINYERDYDSASFALLLRDTLFSKPSETKGIAEYSFRLATDTFLAHSRSSIKIQDGCSNSCSYCAIHIARGKSVSLPAADILERVKKLEDTGQAEVVFTTVNIAQYRGEYQGTYLNFTEMLALLIKNTDRICFRISSLYPELVDDRFCEVIRSPRVRPHFHLSVQSGSDAVLAAMNRNYHASDVIHAVEMLRKAKDNPFFACDIIAGFPGETDDDFEKTMNLVQTCRFAYVHAFPFSARPGTAAFSMKNKVTQSLAGKRVKQLTEFAVQSKIAYIESWSGKTADAVAENVRHPAVLAGQEQLVHAVTENFLHCEVKCSGHIPSPGDRITVRILRPLDERIRKGDELEAEAEYV